MRLQLAASDLGQRQQRVDELRHPSRCAPDAIQISEPFCVELLRVPFDQQLAEAVDSTQRRAQIVSDGIVERFELAVRGFERGGPLLQRQLQPALVLAQAHVGRVLVKSDLDDTTQLRRLERLDEIRGRIRARSHDAACRRPHAQSGTLLARRARRESLRPRRCRRSRPRVPRPSGSNADAGAAPGRLPPHRASPCRRRCSRARRASRPGPGRGRARPLRPECARPAGRPRRQAQSTRRSLRGSRLNSSCLLRRLRGLRPPRRPPCSPSTPRRRS